MGMYLLFTLSNMTLHWSMHAHLTRLNMQYAFELSELREQKEKNKKTQS